jgi:reactive intermediate/imine deaminase
MRQIAVLVFTLLASACASRPTRPLLEFLSASPPPPGPFSRAVRVDHLVFISGQIGVDSSGQLIPGGIEPETRQTLENIRTILAQNGLGMDRVVKCTVFLADINEWKAMNEVYATFFPGQKPTRSALGTNGLVLNARVEIECIAAIE